MDAGVYLAEIKVGRAVAPRGWIWHIIWPTSLIVGIVLQQRLAFGGSPLFLAVGAGGLVQVALPTIGFFARKSALISKVFYTVGVASYSLYATHVPVFHAIKLLTGGSRADSVLWALACTGIAIGFSLIFFQIVERHTLRMPKPARLPRADFVASG